MFERYTERARRVIFFGRYEASQFGSVTIETEHFLLGLLREDRNLIARFFTQSSFVENIRDEVTRRAGVREKVSTSIDLPLSNECKRILAYANEEAERLNHRHIGTEHLLLGTLREENCLAAELLRERGLSAEAVREQLAREGPAPADGGNSIDPLQSQLLGLSARLKYAQSLKHDDFSLPLRRLNELFNDRIKQDWSTLDSELRLFCESLAAALQEPAQDPAGREGFAWQSLLELRTGLSTEEDMQFRFRLAMILVEVMIKRYEQRMKS